MDFSEYQTEIIEDIKSCLEGLQVQPILFIIGSHNDVMLKRPLREGFSQRPFQHMDISNEPVIRHFH